MRRILAIDGGGVKGVFPAALLATIEDTTGASVARYFDLIVGTSTGGIIALGLGLGLSATEILQFYRVNASKIFAGNPLLRKLRHFGLAKYSSTALRTALESIFQDRVLGESKKRLVIPSLNLETGEVYIWKTAHSERLERDYKTRVVEVALATAAAPSYFPTYRSSGGVPLVDGGIWANNPVAVAVVESIGVLKWPAADLRVLSLGCTTTPFDIIPWRFSGWAYWAYRFVDLFMAAQANSATGMAQHLLADRDMLIRISPVMPANRFALDRLSKIPSLAGLGESEARKELPRLRKLFFEEPVDEDFVPFHR